MLNHRRLIAKKRKSFLHLFQFFHLYPLAICYIAIEHEHRNSGFSHWKWWISHRFLYVYQRVTNSLRLRVPELCKASVSGDPPEARCGCLAGWPRRPGRPASATGHVAGWWLPQEHRPAGVKHGNLKVIGCKNGGNPMKSQTHPNSLIQTLIKPAKTP